MKVNRESGWHILCRCYLCGRLAPAPLFSRQNAACDLHGKGVPSVPNRKRKLQHAKAVYEAVSKADRKFTGDVRWRLPRQISDCLPLRDLVDAAVATDEPLPQVPSPALQHVRVQLEKLQGVHGPGVTRGLVHDLFCYYGEGCGNRHHPRGLELALEAVRVNLFVAHELLLWTEAWLIADGMDGRMTAKLRIETGEMKSLIGGK